MTHASLHGVGLMSGQGSRKGLLMADEINADCTAVFRGSWYEGWSWSAGGPKGVSLGFADTEEEAWEKARLALKGLGVKPKGQG